jgi:hypothetical protein
MTAWVAWTWGDCMGVGMGCMGWGMGCLGCLDVGGCMG